MIPLQNKNFWQQDSGDYQNSPWTKVDTGSFLSGISGRGQDWNTNMQHNYMSGPYSGGNTGVHATLNNDAYKTNRNYGHFTNSGGGGGYWSGGRPGAGSWVEPFVAQSAVPAPTPAAANDMVPGASAQIPQRTAPQSEGYSGPQDFANFDWQMYASMNPDVLATGYGVGTYTNPWDQMWGHYNQANSLGDRRAYVGYADGRTNPAAQVIQQMQGGYTSPQTYNNSFLSKL